MKNQPHQDVEDGYIFVKKSYGCFLPVTELIDMIENTKR